MAEVAGILRRLHRRRIGDDAHDLFPQRLLLLEELDRVVVALAHLLPVEAGDRRDLLAGCSAPGITKAPRRRARSSSCARSRVTSTCCFWSRPTGTMFAVVDQDVRRHQHRIGEEAVRRRLAPWRGDPCRRGNSPASASASGSSAATPAPCAPAHRSGGKAPPSPGRARRRENRAPRRARIPAASPDRRRVVSA